MTVILDSQTVIWAIDDPARLTKAASSAIQNSQVRFVSTATIWEIGIKYGLGKLSLSLPYRPWIELAVRQLNASILPVTIDYCEAQSSLPHIHGDPFDRMIASQCLVEKIPVVSSDAIFDAYGITRIW